MFSDGGGSSIESPADTYQVYLGPLPDTLGIARTFHFFSLAEAERFAREAKSVAFHDYWFDRRVVIKHGAWKQEIELEA